MTNEGNPDTPPPATGLLTQKEYARRKGWSKQYVNQLVKQGRIPMVNGRIDPMTADAALAGFRDPSRDESFRSDKMNQTTNDTVSGASADPIPGLQGTFTKARTVREHFRAMREKIEYEAAAGQLVSRTEVETAAFEVGLRFRHSMTMAAKEIARAIALDVHCDEARAGSVAMEAMRAALLRLADEIKGDEWGFDKGLPVDSDS